MPNFSIKDVPEALADALRQRAARNHRSLQGELMALLEAAVSAPATAPAAREPVLLRYAAPVDGAGTAPPGAAEQDDLLARLDAIVAGSQWGSAPLLSREQLYDRRLMRELDYEARRAENGT